MNKNYKTIIIGKRSNLSQVLSQNINDVILIDTLNVMIELESIRKLLQEEKINIIFNNFQTATGLNDLASPEEYIFRSIMVTSKVLAYIKDNSLKINKIIYTSSSSVYGNNILCNENDALLPLNLHASLKVSNEKLIEKFCLENSIDFTIARIFNMYGGDDSFSIVSKIIDAYKNEMTLTVVNDGNGVRDFIFIEDVVYIYKKLLSKKDIKILNLGTGEGTSIRNIIGFLKNNNIILKTTSIKREELKISTADNTKLLALIGEYRFKSVEEFIKNQIEGVKSE